MTVYSIVSKQSGGSWKPGFNMVYARLDLGTINNGAGLATGDVVRLAQLPDYGILYESFYRMPVDSTSIGTADIGTTLNGTGQEIKAALDLDNSGREWIQGTVQTDGGGEEIMDAESYLTYEQLTAAAADGVVEVAIIILMFPGGLVPMSQTVLT